MTRSPSESPGTPRLAWAAAFVLAACLCAVAVGSTRIAARWGVAPAAAAAGLVTLALLAVLIGLLVRQRAAVAAAAHSAAGSGELAGQLQQYNAELGLRVAENQQLQAQLQRYMSELEQREDQRRASVSARSAALEKVLDQLVRVQLPLAFSGSAVPPVAEEAPGWDGELATLCGQVLASVSSGAAELHEQLAEQRETSRLAVVALARRVQASAHRIQEEAVRMAQRHPADPDVLESSMRVDHAAAQQARHAQSMAVLSGEWPGQQWAEPLPLVDVGRAAASRIVPYQRVAVSGDPDVAAEPRAVEPLIHLVAELLANATQSSPPASQVLVTVRTVQRGAVIEIDDGGVGMDEHRLEQAREVASGRRPTGLTSLGEIPQTGLAVVGQYARRHGFGVDLVPSPYGGVRAVALVPADLVQILDGAGKAPAREPSRALTAGPAAASSATAPMPAVPAPTGSAVTEAQAATAAAAAAVSAGTDSAGTDGAGKDSAGTDSAGTGRGGGLAPAAAGGAAADGDGPGDPHPTVRLPVPGRAAASARSGRHASGREAVEDEPPSDPAVTAAGLPQRRSRRGQTDLAASRALTPAPLPAPPPAPQPSPAEAGAWLGAFLSAGPPTRAGAATGDEQGGRRRGPGRED